jgi:hypothetical protein
MGWLLEIIWAPDGETVKPSSKELDQLNFLEKRSAESETWMKTEKGN